MRYNDVHTLNNFDTKEPVCVCVWAREREREREKNGNHAVGLPVHHEPLARRVCSVLERTCSRFWVGGNAIVCARGSDKRRNTPGRILCRKAFPSIADRRPNSRELHELEDAETACTFMHVRAILSVNEAAAYTSRIKRLAA